MKRTVFYPILLIFFVIPALYFSVFGGPFREKIIFDFLADEYTYKGAKSYEGEFVNVFYTKDEISKVKSNILKFKSPYETFEGQRGMFFINYPEAVVALRVATQSAIKKMKLPIQTHTIIIVSSPPVGERLYNRGGHVYVHVHPRYYTRYRSRYGRYFRGHGSHWGK